MKLDVEQVKAALLAVNQWRHGIDATPPCPACGQPALAIEDRSARPHAEWYHLTCRRCGLDDTLNIPLAPPMGG